MTDKFTPGPWQVDGGGMIGAICDANGDAVAQTQQRLNDPLHIVRRENARLVAASPDLLAACRKALPIVAAMCNALGETCDEEAADALGSLRDVLALFPED